MRDRIIKAWRLAKEPLTAFAGFVILLLHIPIWIVFGGGFDITDLFDDD